MPKEVAGGAHSLLGAWIGLALYRMHENTGTVHVPLNEVIQWQKK